MEEKIKTYNIKVPVFSTEMIPSESSLLPGITYDEMVSFVVNNISFFKQNIQEISFENRNKTKKTVIDNIDYFEYPEIDSSNKCLLLKISAYTTNFYDGFVETTERINIEKNTKIGSDNNFVMIYPVIKGIDPNNLIRYYLVLVYEDHTKTNDELIKIAKNVLNKIIKVPIANIKLPKLLEELEEIKFLPELYLKFSSISNHENDVDVKYKEYHVKGKFKKEKEDYYKNLPFEKVKEILETSKEGDYQRLETKIISGKKEYKYTKELINEASDTLKQTVEKIFNATTVITQDELNKSVNEPDFIYEKLRPILINYLSTDEN
jgi:hypothetical protein